MMLIKRDLLPFFAVCLLMTSLGWAVLDGVEQPLVLPPSEDNPRNSEGDFVELADGRVLFVYTHFTGGGSDHDAAWLAGRISDDGGKSWSEEDIKVLENEGAWNVMSVSLLRLDSGKIALLYLRKNAEDDCMPFIRFSEDEAKTWSDPVACIAPEDTGYYVVNNDRLVQLSTGRLIIPAARHAKKGEDFSGFGRVRVLLSDDGGQNWRFAEQTLEAPEEITTGLQEPGVVELKDGRLWMLHRTSAGVFYESFSEDMGETWTEPAPTEIETPVSPCTIERIPSTGDLLLAWNDHEDVAPEHAGKRTPYTVAISSDEGKTWQQTKNLETSPEGWYCYTGMDFVDDAVLLSYCAEGPEGRKLAETRVARFPVDWLYAE